MLLYYVTSNYIVYYYILLLTVLDQALIRHGYNTMHRECCS